MDSRVRALVEMEKGLGGRLRDRPLRYGALLVFGVVLVATMLGLVLAGTVALTTDASDPLLSTVAELGVNLVGVVCVVALLNHLGWWRGVGFVGRSEWRATGLLAFPALIGVVSAVGGVASLDLSDPLRLAIGLPLPLLTGFWEEGLTRGVLLSLLLIAALRAGRGPVGAVVISATIFGLMHVIYALGGGSPASAAIQVVYATTIGIGFGALLLRTNALWPLAGIHALFNLGSEFAGASGRSGNLILLLILASLSLAAYGLFLLRGVKASDDQAPPSKAPEAPGGAGQAA